MIRGVTQVAPRDTLFLHRLIYQDGKGSKLLHSEKYNLRGKPDFIFKSIVTGRLVPIELKSGKAAEMPRHGDIMQLAAYFLIIEDTMERRPKKGYLRYKDAMFKIKNTARLRKAVTTIMNEMRQMLVTGEGAANPSFVNCRYCAANGTVCEFWQAAK